MTDPTHGQQAAAQARALLAARRPADAVTVLGQALASQPNDFNLHCLLAQALLALDRGAEALRATEEALALNPEDEWPHRLRALSLRAVGRKREAVEEAREAARLDPQEPATHRVLGDALLDMGQAGPAARVAEHLAGLAPGWVGTHDLLGRVALRQRKGSLAEQHFRRGLALDPENATLLNNLGVALGMQHKNKQAIDAYHQAARLNPAFDLARKNLKRSTARYLGAAGVGGSLVFIALAQGLRAAAAPISSAASPIHLSPFPTGMSIPFDLVLAVLLCALLVSPVAVLQRWLVRGRLRRLDPVIQRFYESERHRDHRARLPFAVFYLAGMLILFASLVLVAAVADSHDTAAVWIVLCLLIGWAVGAKLLWKRFVAAWFERLLTDLSRAR